MSEKHTVQIQRDEHIITSGATVVAAKKVIQFDINGLPVEISDELIASGVSVYQGTQPWNSLGTVSVANATISVLGSQGEVFNQDASTLAINILDYSHHEIHSGSHYFLKGYNTLNNNNVHDYTIKTPNTTKWAHLLFNIEASSIIEMDVYEGASVLSGASLAIMTPYNNNRNSLNTSDLIIWSLPSVASVGNLIESHKWLSRANVGELSRDNELVLKQNETYLWRFTSGANDNLIDFYVNWYEHVDKK